MRGCLVALTVCAAALWCSANVRVALGAASGVPLWQRSPAAEAIERETSGSLYSPVSIGSTRYASQLFNSVNNRRPSNSLLDETASNIVNSQREQVDLFQCFEPTREHFDTFVRVYNRSFNGDSAEQLDRLNLFVNTLKRIILLNRIVQDEVFNRTNYDAKPDIRNYHFIMPAGAKNAVLWYADITDCELGLIKYIMFDLFYLIDKNEMAMAYKLALDNSQYLPLLSADGFEQLANILLVRLYDRFKGDEKMNQLFQWPLYLKKLAGYVYSRRQAMYPLFNAKMPLIAFAYPSYFKDVKYNAGAVNRTGDNVHAHQEHEKFNKFHNRKFVNLHERNKRLAIFRQRWTLLDLLNDEESKRWLNATTQPDWMRIQYQRDLVPTNLGQSSSSGAVSERLRAEPSANTNPFDNNQNQLFKQTRFSDLTDAEFVAFLTNDFSLLDNSRESADFIDNNFPIQPLNDQLRQEIATELELRRALVGNSPHQPQKQLQQQHPLDQRKSLVLARKVVDELIGDVGLPIGSVFVSDISEQEHYTIFNKLAQFYDKPYSGASNAVRARFGRYAQEAELTDTDLIEERQRRYEQFKFNYGRFRAWFIKENWPPFDENQMLAMLRLSDLSWAEIKLTLFKVCCLSDDQLAYLSSQNATMLYLGSNPMLCQSMSGSVNETNASMPTGSNAEPSNELAALELYYYYSVHFNKHHASAPDFQERFNIFRRNIDQVRQYSCTRGLTLFASLKLKQTDTLSTIDVLDPRRSYTDDINLDRYEYFSLQSQQAQQQQQQQQLSTDDFSAKLRTGDDVESVSHAEAPSRAGISYRREPFFSNLLQRPTQLAQQSARPSGPSYPDKLSSEAQNSQRHALKYRQNSVHRIYDLVMQRYRYCMKTLRNIDLGNDLRQQCQSSGPLADGAANIWAATATSGAGQQPARLQQDNADQCAFYRQGLEPWAEGLMRQDLIGAQLIASAKCVSWR